MVADPERADAVVVNTCAFIQAAKRESIDTILAAADLKEQGRASAVFVTGCLAERYTRELRQELPEADAIVPFADYSRLPELLRSRLPNGSALGPKAGAATALASPRRPGSASRRGRDPRVRSLWSSWLRDVTVTARSAPSRPSAAASARGGRPRFWTRWRGSPVMASPRSAWSRRTPPATARTSAGASC